MENQKNSYPANRLHKTPKNRRDRYVHNFCAGDTFRNTRNSQNQGDPIMKKIIIRPGTLDPLTGMEITIDMIHSWHRMDDVECKRNNRIIHASAICRKNCRPFIG